MSWVTELEARGYSWRTAAGLPKDCFALMKALGFNAVRLRVWVDPKDGWNSGDDLAAKARRAAKLRLPVMLDFHYSDTWADPGKQIKPACVKREYRKDTMVCEFGMPTHPFDPARAATAALLAALRKTAACRGVFYWEPESFPTPGGYTMGACTLDGKVAVPTPALAPFRR